MENEHTARNIVPLTRATPKIKTLKIKKKKKKKKTYQSTSKIHKVNRWLSLVVSADTDQQLKESCVVAGTDCLSSVTVRHQTDLVARQPWGGHVVLLSRRRVHVNLCHGQN